MRRPLLATLVLLGCSQAPTPPSATPTELTAGDLTVRASSDGSFAVVVGGRTLLSTPAAPLSADAYTQSVRSVFGI